MAKRAASSDPQTTPKKSGKAPVDAATDADHGDGSPTADYRHKTAKRKNNPPAKIAAEGTVPAIPKARYAYSPHLAPILRFDPTADADRASAKVAALIEKAAKGPLSAEDRAVLAEALANREPWLEWATKREQHQRGYFEVDPVALHIHERVSAQAVMRVASRQDVTHSLFADPEQQYHEAVQFYRHDIDWTNRLILGDSLQVMSSLARREDLAGKVQMIYMDPPYGIKFASNFQPKVGEKDVKDKDADLTREPEMVRAYRDTWHLGIHSYLSYLRDRLLAARELLADSGSVFVQISDENLHLVRQLLEEVFGRDNFQSIITFRSSVPLKSTGLPSIGDYVIWYARDVKRMKRHDLYLSRADNEMSVVGYIEEANGHRRSMAQNERGSPSSIATDSRAFATDNLVSSGFTPTCIFDVEYQGRRFSPSSGKSWKTNTVGMARLVAAERLNASGDTVRAMAYLADYPVQKLSNFWTDTTGVSDKRYVVETATRVVTRCLLMTTDPGDLVLDPTCGSGTTAFFAEQWGRRWITIDTSRVAVAIARQRMLTAKFDYFRTRTPENQPNGNPGTGFIYESVPHITLGRIAQNTNLDPIFAKHEPLLDAALAATNKALEKVTDATRAALCAKLAAKVASPPPDGGLSSLTDADDRRWLLPKTKPDAVTSAIVTAFGKKQKKPPTPKQIKAITDCIPQRAEVGKSSVPANGNGWEHWQVPFDADSDWPKELQQAVTEYRKAWRAKMDEVNACIAANAEQEELVDQPEIVRNVTRVSGPFTVEAVQPPELSLGDPVTIDEDGGAFAGAPGELNTMDGEFSVRFVETQGDIETKNAAAYLKQMFDLLKKDGVRFLNNKQMQWTRLDPLFEAGGSGGIHAEGAWIVSGSKVATDGEVPDATVAVVFGPQYGPVTAKMVEELIRVAGRAKYEDLVIAGFSFDGAATAVIDEAGGDGKGLRLAGGHVMRVHMAHIRPDVNPGMNGLLKEQPGSQLFTVFGQPRIKVRGPGRKGGTGDQKTGEPPEGEYTVEMQGVDIYDPVRNVVEPTNAGKVAAWFLDSDYDGRTFCITQAFFPDRSAWEKLSKALGGSGAIDAERFEAFSGTISLPFPAGKRKSIAVKVIDPRGNEVMKVVGL